MTVWRTYADPPQSDPALSRSERKLRARDRRDEISFTDALETAGTGYVVWMCADALDTVAGPSGVVLDAAHVDDCLPGPWESDLLDLALELKESVTQEEVEMMMQKLDAKRTGKISLTAFIDFNREHIV